MSESDHHTLRILGLAFAIREVEALLRAKKAVGCYNDSYMLAFDDVLTMLRADLARGGVAATSTLMDKVDETSRR